MTSRDLQALAIVTDARYRAAEARMAVLRHAERDLAAQLDALHAAAQARFRDRDLADPAVLAGADLRWEYWIAERRQHLNARRALVLARIEGERDALRRAFGSNQAVEALIEQDKRVADRNALRKAEREG